VSVDWTGSDATLAAALRAFGVESDLSDATLASKAKSAVGEIATRTGIGAGSIESYADGIGQRFIPLDPPAATVDEVTEDGAELDAAVDYRLRPGGILLERLSAGSPSCWRGDLHITYAGAATDDRYDRVVADLVKLSLEWSGLDARRDGDYSEESVGARAGGLGYQEQRDELITELAGMWLR
jgi:hypothetical protein